MKKIKNQTTNAYTSFVYDPNGNYIHTYQTITGTTQADEFHSWQIFDGAGRVRETAADLPGAATGHFSGSYVIYDKMGRVTNWQLGVRLAFLRFSNILPILACLGVFISFENRNIASLTPVSARHGACS